MNVVFQTHTKICINLIYLRNKASISCCRFKQPRDFLVISCCQLSLIINNVALISKQTKKYGMLAFRKCISCYQFAHAWRKCSKTTAAPAPTINIRFARKMGKSKCVALSLLFVEILLWMITRVIGGLMNIAKSPRATGRELNASRREKQPRASPAPLEDDGNEREKVNVRQEEGGTALVNFHGSCHWSVSDMEGFHVCLC